jgi:redox-sensitive bicupin YhaK (pirin superfamily)
MATYRTIRTVLTSKPTVEGAGVHLKRVFGYPQVPMFDPFLLLDDFHSDDPGQYMSGFPWHPHRGIETVTYMLHGKVEHGDSMGNSGTIQNGDIQWMTAGNGIVHQEMPKHDEDNPLLWGFQLWVNLPADQKMMEPRYQDVNSAEVPEVTLENNATVRVLCGTVAGVHGPVKNIIADPEYLDVTVPANTTCEFSVKDGYTVFTYVIEGSGYFAPSKEKLFGAEQLVLFEKQGDALTAVTTDASVRFLLISGKPIGEPVAWYGPIVMNTKAELEVAFEEYRNGTFLKHNRIEKS